MRGEKENMKDKMQQAVIRVKKSDYAASSEFDYKRLEYPREHFLPCQINIEGEELVITYQTAGLSPFTNIRRERLDYRYAMLLDVANIVKLGQDYKIQLSPDNLCYDQCFRVSLMNRDVYKKGEGPDESLLAQYKALIGYSLQKRYSYGQYMNGGLGLLQKKRALSAIYDCSSADEIETVLGREYKEKNDLIKETQLLVDKNNFFLKRGYAVILSFLLVGMLGLAGYYLVGVRPGEQAVMASDLAYIESDYVKIIDALKPMDVQKLDIYHKYILALAYIKSENLTGRQRENILSVLSIKGDERVLRYWIAIGRLDAAEAENLAMQCSNDELLLYAYLKDKSLVELDTKMDGEEKAGHLETLSKKIEELTSRYHTKEEY